MKRAVPITRAFTLIEMVIVIAIIGILAGVILTSLSGSKAKARDVQRISDLNQIKLALDLFADRCKSGFPFGPPLDTPGGAFLNYANNCPTGVTMGTFLPVVPTPPPGTGRTYYDYCYQVSGYIPVGYDYVLHTKLEQPNSVVTKGYSSASPVTGCSSSKDGSYSVTCDNSPGSTDYCLKPN